MGRIADRINRNEGGGFRNFVKKVAPFGGRLLGLDKKDKDKFDPRQQYVGGSKEASEALAKRYAAGAEAGGKRIAQGIDRTNAAADQAGGKYEQLRTGSYLEQQQAQGRAGLDRTRALRSAKQATGVADTEMLRDRQRLSQMADNTERDYQRTADKQLRASQNSTQREALAQGSRGGASGLRAALSGSLNANQQAAQQAQITNAEEHNQLTGMKANLLSQANQVSQNRAGVYGNAAGLFTGREDAARNQAAAQQGIQGNAIGGRYAAQAGAGAQATGAGVYGQGQFLGAEGAKNAAELGAAREQELARQANEKYNYTQDWFPLKRFNAPA